MHLALRQESLWQAVQTRHSSVSHLGDTGESYTPFYLLKQAHMGPGYGVATICSLALRGSGAVGVETGTGKRSLKYLQNVLMSNDFKRAHSVYEGQPMCIAMTQSHNSLHQQAMEQTPVQTYATCKLIFAGLCLQHLVINKAVHEMCSLFQVHKPCSQ